MKYYRGQLEAHGITVRSPSPGPRGQIEGHGFTVRSPSPGPRGQSPTRALHVHRSRSPPHSPGDVMHSCSTAAAHNGKSFLSEISVAVGGGSGGGGGGGDSRQDGGDSSMAQHHNIPQPAPDGAPVQNGDQVGGQTLKQALQHLQLSMQPGGIRSQTHVSGLTTSQQLNSGADGLTTAERDQPDGSVTGDDDKHLSTQAGSGAVLSQPPPSSATSSSQASTAPAQQRGRTGRNSQQTVLTQTAHASGHQGTQTSPALSHQRHQLQTAESSPTSQSHLIPCKDSEQNLVTSASQPLTTTTATSVTDAAVDATVSSTSALVTSPKHKQSGGSSGTAAPSVAHVKVAQAQQIGDRGLMPPHGTVDMYNAHLSQHLRQQQVPTTTAIHFQLPSSHGDETSVADDVAADLVSFYRFKVTTRT